MEEIKLASTNLMTIRNRCLDKVIELIKDKDGKFQDGFAICSIQDLKVQLIDCAGALAEFIISGKPTESIVGKTPILLSASRALTDRKVPLSVQAFNNLMRAKKFMSENQTVERLTDTGWNSEKTDRSQCCMEIRRPNPITMIIGLMSCSHY